MAILLAKKNGTLVPTTTAVKAGAPLAIGKPIQETKARDYGQLSLETFLRYDYNIVSLWGQPGALGYLCTGIMFALAATFGRYCVKWKPRKMRGLIERNVVIWKHALDLNETRVS